MVKSVLWGAALACVLATSPVWAELKIGVVNYGRLMSESPQAKAITAEIRAEFMPRQREIQNRAQEFKARQDKLQRDSATMTDEQKMREEEALRDADRDLQRKQSELQDDFNARRNEDLSRLQRILQEEVQQYAKAQNFDLVLADAGGVLYWTNTLDITPAILTRLQQLAAKPGGAAAAPKPARSSAAH